MGNSIVEAVLKAGVVGAGGAGFPTHIKMAATATHVICNAAECEPLLRADQQVIRLFADQVLRGLRLAMESTGAGYGIVAIKAKHRDAVQTLSGHLSGDGKITIYALDDFYPAGDEHVLIHDVLGKTVPEGGIPPDVGVMVQNVQTLLNITRAVDYGLPVTDRWVTVTGAVCRPTTVNLPIGTPVREAVELAGGPSISRSAAASGALELGFAVIEGGPMMGRVVADLSAPITKITGGLIVLPAGHPLPVQKTRSLSAELRRGRATCCQCNECTNLCPRNLLGHAIEPARMMRAMAHGSRGDGEVLAQAYLCSQCGVCDTYACVMGLSPRRLYAELRGQIAKAGIKNHHRRSDVLVRPYRLERRVPLRRLISRLALSDFDRPASLDTAEYRPAVATIPLLQGAGRPSKPVVTPGQRVNRGDLLGTPAEGNLGAAVHASVSGTVETVSAAAVTIRAG